MPKLMKSSSQPDITYIVSAYNRPLLLPVCLWSLASQTHRNIEVIVTDNASDDGIAKAHREETERIGVLSGISFKYIRPRASDCYRSAHKGVEIARGTWLCFPCDDTYYVPEFGQRMLSAAYSNFWDFLYCGKAVVGADASSWSGYHVWNMAPGRTIKSVLFVRASLFHGFPGLPKGSAPVGADWYFSADMQRRGVRMGSVDEVLVVHN